MGSTFSSLDNGPTSYEHRTVRPVADLKAVPASLLATGADDLSHRQAIGRRLKSLRTVQRLSLKDVARATGLSTSFLSLLERGQTDISLERFRTLARFYHVQPSELLVEGAARIRPAISGLDQAATVDRGPGVEYRIIRAEHPQVLWIRFAPKARFLDFRAHAGQDICMVTKGALELLYGDHTHRLLAGQVARFQATAPHSFANAGDEEAEMIAVGTVPYW